MQILICDDNRATRQLVVALLTSLNHTAIRESGVVCGDYEGDTLLKPKDIRVSKLHPQDNNHRGGSRGRSGKIKYRRMGAVPIYNKRR